MQLPFLLFGGVAMGAGSARIAAVVVLAAWFLPSAASGQTAMVTFADQFNLSGDPVGGGPGYSRIPQRRDANFVLRRGDSVADLLKLARSYFDEHSQTMVRPGKPAPAGSLIYVPSGVALQLDGYHSITFNDGVTLASDRGEVRGEADFAPGAALVRRTMWPNRGKGGVPQMEPIFAAWKGGRLSGFRAAGPYDFRGPNASKTRGWLGGSTFLIKQDVDGTFELDNNELYGWSDFAIWWYHVTTGDAIHHNWVHHNRQVGWGYGLYPGRPRVKDREATLLTEYNLFQENKHSLDLNSARPDSWQPLVFVVRGNVFLGSHGQDIIHAHVNEVDGCSYAGWKSEYINNIIIQPADPSSIKDLGLGLPPPGGYLKIQKLYLDRSHRQNITISKNIRGDMVDPKDPSGYWSNWGVGCKSPYGDVEVDIRTNLQGATIPVEGSRPLATRLKAGEALELDLSGSHDPDGHEIVFHEILWGDGASVTDPAQRALVYYKSARHVYENSGTYLVRVTAFNALGLPSRMRFHEVIVEPSDDRPRFVAFVGTNLPRDGSEAWQGYFSARLLVNDHVVMDWRDFATFHGFERIEWDATPIDAADHFQLTMEVRTERTIADPDGREPGIRGVEFLVDRFYLFGRSGQLLDEDLFFRDAASEPYLRTWGGGGSSSLFNRHDRAIGPSYGRAFALDPAATTKGAVARFQTNKLGLKPR